MLTKLLDAISAKVEVDTPKYPRGYTGRHRAEFAQVLAGKPERATPPALRQSITAL